MGEEAAVDSFMERRRKNDAEYRRKFASIGRTAGEWHRTAETWFDGSVESVDRRLGLCQRMLTASRSAIADKGFDQRHVAAIETLGPQYEALQGLRRQLLTAGADVEDNRSESVHTSKLAHQDRRWVVLEGAKFFRANSDVPMDELQIRARNFAELKTSTLSRNRSESITSAFITRVAQLRRETPKPRIASASPVVDAPAEMIFW